ncbi:MAG: DUF4270 domain-containing protein [Alloprevotella sp.]|nr:DUF4270 domain-containing protein [Alloprevotella sp.]
MILAFSACDEDTASVGGSVIPGYDRVSASSASYSVLSTTLQTDSVLANTNTCYLGSIVDPVTRLRTTCNFLAQFHVPEVFSFPSRDRMLSDDNGRVLIDSCQIRLYFNTYYGDSLTTMKMRVQELDTANVMEEGKTYYTDIDPQQFVSPTSPYRGEMTYTVRDLTRTLTTTSTSYKGNIIVNLTPEYGRFLVEKYYENPDFFRNSYNFSHHVCPGFFFESAGGVGSMVNVEISALDVYFRYHTTETGRDTIVDGMQRLAATEEVIQNSSVTTEVPGALLLASDSYSYVASPAGLFTELTLPMHDVVAGEHYSDSINGAKLSLPCLTETSDATTAFPVPNTLLLVRKADMYKFFETQTIADGVTSYIAEYASNLNAYVYTDIAPLLTLLKNEREAGAGVVSTESEDVRNAKYAAWEAQNPDWNKVVLIPVAADYSTTSSSTGTSVRTLLRVRNELGLSCAKLQGGTGGNLSLDVMYSRFD